MFCALVLQLYSLSGWGQCPHRDTVRPGQETQSEHLHSYLVFTMNKYINLQLHDLNSDPIIQFGDWYQQAFDNNLRQPNAMSLATADSNGNVSSRLVLLRTFDKDGFVFFTGYETKKAQAIAENPNVALLFPWLQLNRQVRIEGTAVPISKRDSLQFFATRPRGSQLGAWLTQSSEVITSRQVLQGKMAELKQKFRDGRIPLPDKWGGYRVVPQRFEFWQAGQDALHDRFEYSRVAKQSWEIKRLLP